MRESMNKSPESYEAELDQLFAAYREACPASEARADFMPRLWEQIDGNQKWTSHVWKWANGMVAAAAAASLFLVMLQLLPKHSPEFYGATYLETLADQHGDDEVLENVAMLNVRAPRESPSK